jgi:ABC-type Zn uptake system ZnuABC Zn-binding protein ZnuA
VAERVEGNRTRFLATLDERIAFWRARLAPAQGAALIAYHNSWPYFARRFHLDLVDFIEPKEGVAPSPARLASLMSVARESGVRAVLHEAYEPREVSRLLAGKLGVPLLVLAPSVGSVPEAGDYLSLLDHDVAVLADALAPPVR